MNSNFHISANSKQNNALKTILWSGLVAGILDALAGLIVYYIWFDFNPFQVVQYIASGVFGPSSINGGVSYIIYGLFFHFVIAYAVAAIYFYAYPKISILSQYKITSGLLFGLGVWLVMNLLILPYTNVLKSPFDASLAFLGILWHMVLVGLPIAIITSNHYSKNLSSINK